MRKMKNKGMLAAILMMLVFALAGCGAKEVSSEQETAKGSDHADQYLEEYFNVSVGEDLLTAEGFSEALTLVAGEEAKGIKEYTSLDVLKASVDAADYKELVLTYPKEKIENRLKEHGIEFKGENEDAAYIAAAADTGFVSKEIAEKAAKEEAYEEEDIVEILMSVAEVNGDARNYLGMSDDKEIYAKMDQAWNSFLLFDDGTLSEIGKNAVLGQVTTGYNLKSNAYNARFLKDLTLQYGHSDIKHAHQLIGLLNSENIVAKVQLEPKISIYEYLPEWGPIPETTPTYEVRQYEDRYLVYAVEYDMQLEFDNTDDLNRFDEVINNYAKKNKGNEEAEGLIAESWWQPLYTTVRTDMPEEAYHELADCVIENGMYSLHSFCVAEDQAQVVENFEQLSGDLKVTPVARYCNTAFYHYMTGDDYQ